MVAPYEYSIVGKDQVLNFALNAHVTKVSNQTLVWDFDLDAFGQVSDVIGGGIAFKLDLETFGSELGEPDILPNNRGWTWGRQGGNRIEVNFDPPLPFVGFERATNRSEIRAFFYKGEVPEGHRRYVATLNISGDMAARPDHCGTIWIGR